MNFRQKITLSLLLTFVLGGVVFAQVVEIPDPNLDASIRHALGLNDNVPIRQRDMLRLEHLDDRGRIADLTGLEHAVNLRFLYLSNNDITDISPLAELTKLEILDIAANPLRDLTPLATLTNLWSLSILGCPISDLRPLAGLRRLKELFAFNCAITDITPLSNFTQLKHLNLARNRISDISPLATLTALETLRLEHNRIVDISPLGGVIALRELYIYNNRILDHSPLSRLALTHIERDEECDMPRLPIQDRIESRSLPSVCLAFDNGILNQGGNWWNESIPYAERAAAHDLWWHGPGVTFHISLQVAPQGYQIMGYIPRELAYRDELLSRNPNMLFLADLRQDYARIVRYGEDWFGWVRDANGRILPVDARDPHTQYLIDYRRPEVQDDIVQRAVAVAQCGLYDGIMYDAWSGRDYSILRRIREQVPEDFLILFNTNHWYIPELAPYINGSFMETFPDVREEGYTRDRIIEIETNLMAYEANAREPQINCLRGFGVGAEAPDSPNNRRWMRLFTTMSLTLSDGYVIYTLGDIGGQRQFQKHIWHRFWDADLGQPVGRKGQLYQETDGLYIREFTNGWAVYNNSGAPQVITLPEETQGVASGLAGTEHALADLDGEMYLRVPTENPADVNEDGVVNILDLILVAQAISTGGGEADVNGDGVVNVFDLVQVAGAIGGGGAAPSASSLDPSIIGAADLERWIAGARGLGVGDANFLRGIRFLEGLLAGLTPDETTLLPNYPNPFNPETWIPYRLAREAEVAITIYDTKGTLVRRLALGNQSAGHYAMREKAVYWDGRNEDGEAVASGIYIYQFRAGDYAASRRMVIVK